MASLTINITILALLVSLARAQDSNACILTNSTCQCSSSDPSGVCVSNIAEGSCLLGVCSAGYRCDCFGYELCSIKACTRFVSDADTIPSETVPFQCHMKENATDCTSFTSILETVTSAQYAVVEAVANDVDACDAVEELLRKVQVILDEKKIVRAALDELEASAVEINETDLRALKELADSVDKGLEATVEQLQQAVREANSVTHSMGEARIEKRRAVRLQEETDRAKIELEEEERKQREERPSEPCVQCSTIRERIATLEAGRRTASRRAGERAQVARRSRRRSQENNQRGSDLVREVKVAASESVSRVRSTIASASTP